MLESLIYITVTLQFLDLIAYILRNCCTYRLQTKQNIIESLDKQSLDWTNSGTVQCWNTLIILLVETVLRNSITHRQIARRRGGDGFEPQKWFLMLLCQMSKTGVT